jgi:hypothetical protein
MKPTNQTSQKKKKKTLSPTPKKCPQLKTQQKNPIKKIQFQFQKPSKNNTNPFPQIFHESHHQKHKNSTGTLTATAKSRKKNYFLYNKFSTFLA